MHPDAHFSARLTSPALRARRPSLERAGLPGQLSLDRPTSLSRAVITLSSQQGSVIFFVASCLPAERRLDVARRRLSSKHIVTRRANCYWSTGLALSSPMVRSEDVPPPHSRAHTQARGTRKTARRCGFTWLFPSLLCLARLANSLGKQCPVLSTNPVLNPDPVTQIQAQTCPCSAGPSCKTLSAGSPDSPSELSRVPGRVSSAM